MEISHYVRYIIYVCFSKQVLVAQQVNQNVCIKTIVTQTSIHQFVASESENFPLIKYLAVMKMKDTYLKYQISGLIARRQFYIIDSIFNSFAASLPLQFNNTTDQSIGYLYLLIDSIIMM